jgi:hypothetical protein
MSFYSRRFNLYLLVPLTVCLLAPGCSMFHKHKDKDPIGIVRVHIENESRTAGPSKTITVLRSQPVEVNISTDPILTEADVLAARLLNAPGGYAVEIRFDETAGWKLEQYTAINPGKHLAIFGQWGDKPEDGRWLSAPLIVHLNTSAMLTFTPDASHAEAEKWVKGLNFVAKKNADVKDKQ